MCVYVRVCVRVCVRVVLTHASRLETKPHALEPVLEQAVSDDMNQSKATSYMICRFRFIKTDNPHYLRNKTLQWRALQKASN